MDDEIARVMQEAAERLRSRGVEIALDDDSEQVATLLEAVERFELEVERQGGDLMVDSGPEPEQPDDPRFVLPKREAGEGLDAYASRIDDATVALRRGAR